MKFSLNEVKPGTHTAHIGVTAEGGNYLFTPEVTFTSECGPESAGIIDNPLPERLYYYIDGNVPFFEFPQFPTASVGCLIYNYTIWK